MGAWHTYSAQQAIAELETDRTRGLTQGEAERRLERYGPNRLEGGRRPGLLRRLWGQLTDPMVLVLLAAAGLSLWASGGEDWLDAAIILVIVVVNACISLSQEDSAEKALAALRDMSAPLARVVRDGKLIRLETDRLVPGDIIHLEAGDLVPADARLLEAAGLQADESALTGESAPVSKGVLAALPEDTPLAERANLVMASTVLTRGRAAAVVIATGMDTEVGRIAGLLLDQEEGETPLQKKMAEISRALSFVCLCVCAVMFGVGLLQGRGMLDMFLTAVSLAVAAIPEGLPAIVTIVLALGVGRMAKRRAIVKKLPAVETLGCAGVICSDKTGTLTQNKMTVVEVWTPRPSGRETALTIGALCSDAALTWKGREPVSTGDPTEAALVTAAAKEGLDKNELEGAWPRRGELPFDSERKLMTTVHAKPGGGYRVCVKGAPDVLSRRCRLDSAAARRLEARNEAMASRALRVLGVAYKDLALLPAQLSSAVLEQGLTFAGLIGMIDPPRPEVKAAVERCFAAGIRPVMITGDHKLTAVAIARELGICRPGDLALTGDDLDFLPQEVLEEEVDKFSVYARVSPEHKMRIVQAWQARGKVAAMTGDGVNDAPALKKADIGVAMGITGTEVSKDAAAMILADDNFATIVKAVVNGRSVYENIKNAIQFLLSGNAAGIFCVLYASLLALPVPFQPVHLLFINLLTDSLPAIAIGMEPARSGLLHRKPRDPKAPILSKGLLGRIGLQGLLIAIVTMAAFYLGYQGGDAALASTMAFATLTLARLFHGFNCRGAEPIFRLKFSTNPYSVWAFLAGVVLLLAVLIVPGLQGLFQVSPSFALGQLAQCLGLAILPTVIIQIVKAGKTRQAGG